MRDYYFKKTMSGMVLMVRHRFAAICPGQFYYRNVKADEEQAQEFIREMAVMDHKSTIFDEIKKSNPELLI